MPSETPRHIENHTNASGAGWRSCHAALPVNETVPVNDTQMKSKRKKKKIHRQTAIRRLRTKYNPTSCNITPSSPGQQDQQPSQGRTDSCWFEEGIPRSHPRPCHRLHRTSASDQRLFSSPETPGKRSHCVWSRARWYGGQCDQWVPASCVAMNTVIGQAGNR